MCSDPKMRGEMLAILGQELAARRKERGHLRPAFHRRLPLGLALPALAVSLLAVLLL